MSYDQLWCAMFREDFLHQIGDYDASSSTSRYLSHGVFRVVIGN